MLSLYLYAKLTLSKIHDNPQNCSLCLHYIDKSVFWSEGAEDGMSIPIFLGMCNCTVLIMCSVLKENNQSLYNFTIVLSTQKQQSQKPQYSKTAHRTQNPQYSKTTVLKIW